MSKSQQSWVQSEPFDTIVIWWAADKSGITQKITIFLDLSISHLYGALDTTQVANSLRSLCQPDCHLSLPWILFSSLASWFSIFYFCHLIIHLCLLCNYWSLYWSPGYRLLISRICLAKRDVRYHLYAVWMFSAPLVVHLKQNQEEYWELKWPKHQHGACSEIMFLCRWLQLAQLAKGKKSRP